MDHDLPRMNIIMIDVNKVANCWYQETTDEGNFFILRMAMVPPADRNRLTMRRRYKTKIGKNGSEPVVDDSSLPPRTHATTPTSKNITKIKSYLRTVSFKIRKARIYTTKQVMFEMIVMIVRGIYFVTEKLMKSFVVPQKVLKTSGHEVSRSQGSHTSFLRLTFMAIIIIPIPKQDLINIIGNGSSAGTCVYRSSTKQ